MNRTASDVPARGAPVGAGSVRGTSAPLRVALAGMAERTRAQLAWHFEHARPRPFTEASGEGRADVLLVDADHPDAAAALRASDARAARAGEAPPALVLLALDAPGAALARRAAHVLTKPVSAEALLDAARAVRGASASRGARAASPMAPATPAVPAGATAGVCGPPRTAADADALRSRLRERTLCGEREVIDAALAAHRADGARGGAAADLFFDPSAHLGALLERELAVSGAGERTGGRGLTIALAPIELFVLPDVERVYASATLRSVGTVRAAFAPLAPGAVSVTHHAGESMGALLHRVRTQSRGGYTLDAFTWLAALMSSRGRLPVGTDITRPLRLRRWPNLTRLEPVPHAFELARRWTAAPRSIDAIAREGGVEACAVHAFHNAARALGLFAPADGTSENGGTEDRGRG